MSLSIERSTTLVSLLEGERWWGGAVQDGALMPFGTAGYTRDLRVDHAGNQAVPFLVSNRGRYLWSDAAFGFTFDAGHLRIDGEGTLLEAGFEDLAGAFRAASRRHFPPSGTMPDPIALTAPQFNTWMEMGYEPTQRAVLAYARSILNHGLPPGVLILDDGWSENYGDWRFHGGRFPDPAAMMRELTEMGFAVMLWIVPFVSPDCAVARSLEEQGLLLRSCEGKTAIRRWWNGHSAILDLTHPGAIGWLCEGLDKLVERYGIAGFKLDAGDPDVFRASDQAHRPTDPVGACEIWGGLGERYRLCEYRACWKRGGGPSIQRLRDKHHRWGRDGLADLIPNALAQGLAGHAFVCPDMVGGGDIGTSFGTAVDPELFVRTAQCSALFPMVQFSIAPWRVLDGEHWAYCADAIRLRQRLAPEFLALAAHAARTGEPMIRHLAYAFPEGCYEDVADQFLLGDDLLVAPVLEPGARSRKVVFPPGEWTADAGERFSGPTETEVDAPLGRLPWFRRSS